MASSTMIPLSTIHNSSASLSMRRSTTPHKLKLFPPPMKSKFFTMPPFHSRSIKPTKTQFTIGLAEMTEYQILLQRQLARNEKARTRMAQRRAALKARTSEDQQALLSERERLYQAEYRSRHREKLRTAALKRRHDHYAATYGEDALAEYLRHQQLRRARKRARERTKEPYDSDDMCLDDEDSLDDDDGDCGEES